MSEIPSGDELLHLFVGIPELAVTPAFHFFEVVLDEGNILSFLNNSPFSILGKVSKISRGRFKKDERTLEEFGRSLSVLVVGDRQK